MEREKGLESALNVSNIVKGNLLTVPTLDGDLFWRNLAIIATLYDDDFAIIIVLRIVAEYHLRIFSFPIMNRLYDIMMISVGFLKLSIVAEPHSAHNYYSFKSLLSRS